MDFFRDPEQRRRACRALLVRTELARYWDEREAAPARDVAALVATGGAGLEEGERVLLLAMWTLWTGHETPLGFHELRGVPETEPLCKLLIAGLYGDEAIDLWIERSSGEAFVSTERETHAAAAQLFDDARATLAELGDAPMNMAAAPDACALGALNLADFALMMGVRCIKNDEKRRRIAKQMAIEALGIFASLSDRCATGRPVPGDDDDDEEPPGDSS